LKLTATKPFISCHCFCICHCFCTWWHHVDGDGCWLAMAEVVLELLESTHDQPECILRLYCLHFTFCITAFSMKNMIDSFIRSTVRPSVLRTEKVEWVIFCLSGATVRPLYETRSIDHCDRPPFVRCAKLLPILAYFIDWPPRADWLTREIDSTHSWETEYVDNNNNDSYFIIFILIDRKPRSPEAQTEVLHIGCSTTDTVK
jgi:hypothetical protein